jgi:DNA-binding transcriptional MerR regulator
MQFGLSSGERKRSPESSKALSCSRTAKPLLTVTLFSDNIAVMNVTYTVEQLADAVNGWCSQHGVAPASGQAGERMTTRNVRYYRTLGLVDPPLAGGGAGYGGKHLLQLIAIRLLQAQGLPLNRIRDLLLGRTLEELREIEKRGLAELENTDVTVFRPTASEGWAMTPLDDEFLLISRQGRGISDDVRARLVAVLHPRSESGRCSRGATTKDQ